MPQIPTFVYYVVSSVLILIGVRKYRERKWGKCTNNVSLLGKTAIVTGANSGIGYEIAKDLCKRGAHVILACRNEDAAIEAISRIQVEVERPRLACFELDLSSLHSVKYFANKVMDEYDEIDILIHNAGVSYPDDSRVVTKYGVDIHIGVHYVSPLLLTHLLYEKLDNGKPKRIVILSSSLYQKGVIDFETFNLQKAGKNLYANSKLASMYLCKELSKRFTETSVSVYAVCPGWVLTSLFRHHKSRIMKYFLFILPAAFFFMRSAKQGAQTPIYCATEPGIENESGSFYRDCRKIQSNVMLDDSTSEALWAFGLKAADDEMIIF